MTKIEVLNFIQKNYHQCPDFNAANLLARVSNPVNFKKCGFKIDAVEKNAINYPDENKSYDRVIMLLGV